MRYLKMLLITLAVGAQLPVLAAEVELTMYKNPNCGCCDLWATHLEENGFKVKTVNTTDLASIKEKYGVPQNLAACHTGTVGGYVVEGLVPAEFIQQLLQQRSPTKGIALPGMPHGVPGMAGKKMGPLDIYYLGSGPNPRVFAVY